MSDVYQGRPWLALYDEGVPNDIKVEYGSALEMWQASVRRAGERPLIHYFDQTLSLADLDRQSDALAVALLELGLQAGERVCVYLQNVPGFVTAMLATWKCGAIMVSANPMLKERELSVLLEDSAASVLVCLESLYETVASKVVPGTSVRTVITTSELDGLTEVPPLLAGVKRAPQEGTHALAELVERHSGRKPPAVSLGPDDVAFLTYTSGTTGPPKGAMNTHGNTVFNAQTYRDWVHLDEGDVCLAVAPLFHITGLIAHIAISMLIPMPMILAGRFDTKVTLDAIERHKASFVVGSITVFIALMNDPSAPERDLSSLTKIYSGGAPIAPPTVEAFEKVFGAYIHNIYGMTETTSPSHGVPFHKRAPVDPTSGALSVGIPTFNTVVRILGEDGRPVPTGEIGEFCTAGPQVVPGYWGKPEETAKALEGGEMHTGDVGFMDEAGWFYLVDRKKDMINAGGYKVWPREVEDVLYGHPSVREAAVVGIPDEYRGETVKAIVSLKPGTAAEPDELIAFCKERMAAYKYPRVVEIMDDLPKTVTGKILRRELR